MRQHVQAWSQQHDAVRYNREFTLLALSRTADDTYDVTSLDLGSIVIKPVLNCIHFCVRHHLYFETFSTQVVKDEFGSSLSNGMDTSCDTVLFIM